MDSPDPPPSVPAPPDEPETPRCDVCGEAIEPVDEEGDDEALTGSGLYVWVRGDKIVYEEPPLCASCGTAISMTALGRWEIEEEEG